MRFDHLVTFYTDGGRHYNPATGNYEGTTTKLTTIRANVTDLGTTRSVEVFGKLDVRAKVLRLAGQPPTSWAWLQIDTETIKYRLTTSRTVQKGNTIIVGEDNG